MPHNNMNGHDPSPSPPNKLTPNSPPNDSNDHHNDANDQHNDEKSQKKDQNDEKSQQKDDNEDHEDMLKLSLSSYCHQQNSLHLQPTPVPPPTFTSRPPPPLVLPIARRARRNPSKSPAKVKSEIVPAPYPWATTHRASVHTLAHLTANDITSIPGEVLCKKCEKFFTVQFDLGQKFLEVASFVAENKEEMHHRAPKEWCTPALPRCIYCEQDNSARPVMAEKKRNINWLFLLLGQMLGCCTLDQLKYFCKHTKNHRTGAKDRVLYLAYLALCKQLDPDGPFDK